MATLNMRMISEEWDDYEDLTEKQLDGVKVFMQKLAISQGDSFYYVGNLVKDKTNKKVNVL